MFETQVQGRDGATFRVRYDENRLYRYISREAQCEVAVSSDGSTYWTETEIVPLERINRIQATQGIFVPLYLEYEVMERYGIELRPIVEAYHRWPTEQRERRNAERQTTATAYIGGRTLTIRFDRAMFDEAIRETQTRVAAAFAQATDHAILYGTSPPILTSATEQRAEMLLARHLTPEQREAWNTRRYFDVVMQAEQYRDTYRIQKHGDVLRIRDGRTIAAYCIQPRDERVPMADLALAKKLLLETHPAQFHATANQTGGDYWTPMPIPSGIARLVESLADFARQVAETTQQAENVTEALEREVGPLPLYGFLPNARRGWCRVALRHREQYGHWGRGPPNADDTIRNFVRRCLNNL